MAFLSALSDALWNPWLLGLFFFTGLVCSAGSGWFQLRRLPLWVCRTAGGLLHSATGQGGGLSSIQALATALASTMGTGSIAGVATALTLGGPGAIFWMWVSAILGMMTGCVEKLLSVRYQRPAPGGGLQGGPMFYLRDGVGSPLLAAWFSLACLPATLAGGNLIQSASIAAALESSFGANRLFVGIITTLLAGLAIAGGMGRVARVASALVPAMALLYLGAGTAVLALRVDAIPDALRLIFSCALHPSAALGGGAGWTVAAALRYGVSRGIFTNEAGLGTSAIAHGAARAEHPAQQGMWGIFEVCLSTLVVCTITALTILVSGIWDPGVPSTLTGAPLTSAAFGHVLGPVGNWAVSLSLLLFAFSSILGWSCYGQQCLRYLTGGDRITALYRIIYLGCTLAGALWEPAILWLLVDLCNACMALPNLIAILLLAPEALEILDRWSAEQKKRGPLRSAPKIPDYRK